MTKPLISVITASYNSAKYMQRCIDSVESQTYNNIEFIIIDGGSKDNTVDIIRQNAGKKYSKISYWISEADGGVYYAFNKGLEQARGDWVYFLGSDDVLDEKDTLSRVAGELSKVPENTYFAYGGVDKVDNDGQVILQEGYDSWDKTIIKILEESTSYVPVSHQGMFARSEAFKLWGSFDTNFKIVGDSEHFLRVINESEKAYFINFRIAKMQTGGLSTNIKAWKQTTKEIRLIFDRYNVPRRASSKFVYRITYPIKIFVFSLPDPMIAFLADLSRIVTGRKVTWIKFSKKSKLES